MVTVKEKEKRLVLTVARQELVNLERHERGESVEYDDQHGDHERDVRSPRQ